MRDRRSCLRMEFSSGLGFTVSVDHQGVEIATETAAVQVGVGVRRRLLRHGFALEALVENALDRSVFRAAEGERACAGGLKALITDLLAQPDDALCAAQVDEYRIVEQRENHAVTRRADFLRTRQTPLRI